MFTCSPHLASRKITVIHVDTERTWRGGEAQVFHLATRLDPARFMSVIAAPWKSALADHARKAGIPLVSLAGTGEISPIAIWNLFRACIHYKARIIHVHTSHGLIPAAVAARLCGGRVRIVYSRRTDFPFKTNVLNLSRLKYQKGADIILAVSDAIGQLLVRSGIPSDKIRVVRSGIDVRGFVPGRGREALRTSLGIRPEWRVIGCIAALEPHKDPFCFFEMAKIVSAGRPDTFFLIAGSGRLMEDLQDRIRRNGMEERFKLLGFRTDIPEILAAMDIFSLCSRSEGLGTSILDAMAMEIPVVASRVGGIPEAVDEGTTGLLTPPSDPERHAEAVLSLLRSPETMRRMGRAGRKRVETLFDVARTVRETAQVYLKLLEGG